jgi:hypothetical protein
MQKRKLQSNALPLSYKCDKVAPNVSRTRDHSKIACSEGEEIKIYKSLDNTASVRRN